MKTNVHLDRLGIHISRGFYNDQKMDTTPTGSQIPKIFLYPFILPKRNLRRGSLPNTRHGTDSRRLFNCLHENRRDLVRSRTRLSVRNPDIELSATQVRRKK